MPLEGPLDEPRLRAIDTKIDAGELDEAQRLLSELGADQRLGPAVSYLATKVLLRRGRLARAEVAERMRDLLRAAPDFPEAAALLSRIEAGPPSIEPPPSVSQPAPDPHEIDGDWDEPAPSARAMPATPAPSRPPAPSQWPPKPEPSRMARPKGGAAWPSIPELRTGPEATDSLPIPQLPNEVPTEPPPASPIPTAHPAPHLATPIQDFRAASTRRAPGSRSSAAPAPSSRTPDIPPAPAVPRFAIPRDRTPSYVPPRQSPSDHDRPTITPDQLGGRYSAAPSQPEALHVSRRPAVPATRSVPAATSGRPRVRSAPPPPPGGAGPPTRFELARLLDERRYEEALAAAGPDREESGPEIVLLKARAQLGLGRHDAAMATIRRFCKAPLLEPDLRASGSRVLLELGDHETAFVQSSRAFAEAPDAPLVRLAHAWAALRLARRRDTTALTNTAATALAGMKSRDNPYPALLLALRGCAQAHLGDGGRAVNLAQRALAMDSQSSDAEVALALGSARIGLAHDARQAYLRLRQLAPDEAAAIAPALESSGVALPALSVHGAFDLTRDVAAEIWDPLEMQVLQGRYDHAIGTFEHVCRERLGGLARSAGDQSFSAIAQLAVRVLTAAPVWQHFAPFDLSLWSVVRVSAALDVLYGTQRKRRADADEFPVLALVGAYLGEVLCQTHEARWEGSVLDLDGVRVVAWDGRWTPFRSLASALHHRTPLEFAVSNPARAGHPGADPWSRAVSPAAAPPCPWDPDPWPATEALPKLGRSLCHSIVARYCEERGGGPLDASLASLAALENYISLVAPAARRRDPSATWIPRCVVLIGAYLGEVLCESHGGRWLERAGTPDGPEAYRLILKEGLEAVPLVQVHKRLTGQSSTPLREYATQLLRGA